jgi:hypothetical protein
MPTRTSFPSSFTLRARSTPASSSGSFGTSVRSSITARTSPACSIAFSASAPKSKPLVSPGAELCERQFARQFENQLPALSGVGPSALP